MIRQLIQLFRDQFKQDRIRVSPSEGRFLRLSPPCVLTIGSETVRIVSRTVRETPDGPSVTYECQTDDGTAQLVVHLTPTFRTDLTWVKRGREIELSESDLVLFGTVQSC